MSLAKEASPPSSDSLPTPQQTELLTARRSDSGAMAVELFSIEAPKSLPERVADTDLATCTASAQQSGNDPGKTSSAENARKRALEDDDDPSGGNRLKDSSMPATEPDPCKETDGPSASKRFKIEDHKELSPLAAETAGTTNSVARSDLSLENQPRAYDLSLEKVELSPFLRLPAQLLHQISLRLSQLDILNLSLTCKYFHKTWNTQFWRAWAEQDGKALLRDYPPFRLFFPFLASQCQRCSRPLPLTEGQLHPTTGLHACSACFDQLDYDFSAVTKTHLVKQWRLKKAFIDRLLFEQRKQKKVVLIKDVTQAAWLEQNPNHPLDEYLGPLGARAQVLYRARINELPQQAPDSTVKYAPELLVRPARRRQSKVGEKTREELQEASTSPKSVTTQLEQHVEQRLPEPEPETRSEPQSHPQGAEQVALKAVDVDVGYDSTEQRMMREQRKRELEETLDKSGFQITEVTPIMQSFIEGDVWLLQSKGIYTVRDLVEHLINTFWANYHGAHQQSAYFNLMNRPTHPGQTCMDPRYFGPPNYALTPGPASASAFSAPPIGSWAQQPNPPSTFPQHAQHYIPAMTVPKVSGALSADRDESARPAGSGAGRAHTTFQAMMPQASLPRPSGDASSSPLNSQPRPQT